jgi:LPXTG-motif cell wall-anchored protein
VLTLSYSVRVDSGAFGVTLRNSVTARGDVAPSHDCSPTASGRAAASAGSAVPCIASTTHHTTQSELGPTQEGPSGTLPNTGAPRYAGWAALLGLLLVALGAGLLIGSRRRRGAPRGG